MYIMKTLTTEDCLDMAHAYATKTSGCKKVAVGCAIVRDGYIIALGANRGIPNLCKTKRGCFRVERYGEDSKNHRNPEDCRAIHSEVDALCSAAAQGISVKGAEMYVTRYPCEGCAKAIIAAGIKRVYYGGTARISDQTRDMLDEYNIECTYIPDWKEDLSDR